MSHICSSISKYDAYGIHYVPLTSSYYAARLADALGYQDNCPTNKTFLNELDIISNWGGLASPIAMGKNYF